MKTELHDRTLWFDGTNEVHPSKVPDLLLHGVDPLKIIVTELTNDIEDFNNLSDTEWINLGKNGNEKLDHAWRIPLEYQRLNLDEYILQRARIKGGVYETRAQEELDEIQTRGLGSIFKVMIYIVDQLKEKKQVWGVGRGSSCASLVLHLIGIHEVDPVKYGIPASEFYHD